MDHCKSHTMQEGFAFLGGLVCTYGQRYVTVYWATSQLSASRQDINPSWTPSFHQDANTEVTDRYGTTLSMAVLHLRTWQPPVIRETTPT